MKQTSVSRKLLNLLESLLVYEEEDLLEMFHPSFHIAVEVQKAMFLEESGCKDEALQLLLSVFSKCSEPENDSRFLLPEVMVRTGYLLLKLDYVRDGTSVLLDASSILDRTSLTTVQEDGKDILVDAAAAGAA